MTSTPPLLPPARSTHSQRTECDGSSMATVKPEAAAASVKTDTVVSNPQVLAAPTSTMVQIIKRGRVIVENAD